MVTNGIGVPRMTSQVRKPLPLNPARSMILVARIADMLPPGRELRIQRLALHLPRRAVDYWAGGNPSIITRPIGSGALGRNRRP
jgi:hypothetical protein